MARSAPGRTKKKETLRTRRDRAAHWTAWIVPGGVGLVTFLAFLPALQGHFLGWDDDANFVGNPYYRGLEWSQLAWMFSSAHMGHYIPVTWITLGIDYLLWGMDPAGYHLTSLLLHAANAVLAYAIALRLIGCALPAPEGEGPWPARGAAVLAALFFSIHPLRVESVAWLTERRDVLSAFFCLLALLAYLRFCEARAEGNRSGSRWYGAAVVCSALAIFSKSMAVTLPVVLLVLDVYPLRRLRLPAGMAQSARVLVEKLPIVLLSAVGSAVALIAVFGSSLQTTAAHLGWMGRIMISLYGPAFYLGKTLWPTRLSPLYELPDPLDPLAPSLVAWALVTVMVSGATIALRRRWPGLLAGWIAFIVMLLPVIGIVHNGFQIAADRYTYLPSLALAVPAAALFLWGWRVAANRPFATRVGLPVLALIVLSLAVLTWRQSHVWHDSDTLWSHAVAVSPSGIAHMNLGVARDQQGRFAEAEDHLRLAVALRPAHPEAHFNLGVTLFHQGRFEDASVELKRALTLRPGYAEARINLGAILMRQRRLEEAAALLIAIRDIDPQWAVAQNTLGLIAARRGKLDEAIGHYRSAIGRRPDYPEALYNLGNALLAGGELDGAGEALTRAVSLSPRFAEAHNSLGVVLARQGRLDEARHHFQQAVFIDPGYAEARENLRLALLQQGLAPPAR